MSDTWAEGPTVLTGANGMLGCELARTLRHRLGDGERLHCFDLDLDVRDARAVADRIAEVHPTVVINAAAYTDVDGCESNVDLATAVNVTGAANLAVACRNVGAKLVHFSTDFVFDGASSKPRRPDDETNPLSVYGRTKLDGEVAIRGAPCAHLIIRTSWLFGPHGKNFVEAILSRVTSGQPLSVVTDQIGCPTLASSLATAVVRLLDASAAGTMHYCNAESCSWHEFAVEIVRQSGHDVSVARMTSDALDRPAKRPAYSVLDTSTYTDATGDVPQSWRVALELYFTQREALRAQADQATPGSVGSTS